MGEPKLQVKYRQDFVLQINMMVASLSPVMGLTLGRGWISGWWSEWRRKIVGRRMRLSDRNGLFPLELWGIGSGKAKDLVKLQMPIWLSRELHASFAGFLPFSPFPTKPYSRWTTNYSTYHLSPMEETQRTYISHRRGRGFNSLLQRIYTWSLSAKRLTLRPVKILLLFAVPHQAIALLLIFATGGAYCSLLH